MTVPASSSPPIQSAYTQALLAARASGYALGAEGVARLRRMFGQAIQDLTRQLSLAGDDRVTIERATALRAQIEATLVLIERRIAEITAETAKATAEAVVEAHREANLVLLREYRPDLTDQVSKAFNVVNVRAVATFAARPAVASTFRTLARRNVEDAAPALDNLLGSAIARGVSSGRLTKDVAALLAGGTADLRTYGLDPSDVSGLRTLHSDARRIAVTETNNALREGNRQSLLASPIVKAVKWQVSGRHLAIPGLAPDECDELAEGNDPEDLAELGPLPPGYYSPKRFPLAPHPYCACVQGGPTIFYRPSEWGRVLGKKKPGPTLADFETMVERAIAYFDEGKDRRIVFRAMRTTFPNETIERVGQAVTEAEIRIRKRPKVVTDEQLVQEAVVLLRAEPDGDPADRATNVFSKLKLAHPEVDDQRLTDAVDAAFDRVANVTDQEVIEYGVLLLREGREKFEIAPEMERGFRISNPRAFRLADAAVDRVKSSRSDLLEAATGKLRRNGGQRGDAVVHMVVTFGLDPHNAEAIVDEALDRIRPLDEGLIERTAYFHLQGGKPLAEVIGLLVTEFQISTARAEPFARAALDRLRRQVDYGDLESLMESLYRAGVTDSDALVSRALGRVPYADELRLQEIAERVIRRNTVEYSQVDALVREEIRAGERSAAMIETIVMQRFPNADRARVKVIIGDRLKEARAAEGDGGLPPNVRQELEREAERELRQGISATTVISAIQRFALNMRAVVDGKLQDGFVLTGDEAAAIVLPVQQRIAAAITDDELRILARTLFAAGKVPNDVTADLARSVLAGDTARARRIVAEIEKEKAEAAAKRQSAALGSGLKEAETARARLAVIKAEAESEVAALQEEKRKLAEQIEAIEQLKFARPRIEGSIISPQTAEELREISALEQKLREIREAERALATVRRERAIDAIAVPKHNAGTFNVRTRLPQVKEKFQRGIDVLRRIVPKEVLDGFMTDLKLKPGRAHYSTGEGAFMDKTDGFTTVVHELGHAIEYYRPEILKQSLAWRDGRTVGESLTRMSKIYPNHGYGAHEVTRPDKFFHAYIGKDYGTRASEVLSMGLEEMARDPIGFAEKDPDMFDFIFAVLRSAMDANPPKRGRIA